MAYSIFVRRESTGAPYTKLLHLVSLASKKMLFLTATTLTESGGFVNLRMKLDGPNQIGLILC
jgi:hypothetical protein